MGKCWLHNKPLYKCLICKLVHCKDCQVYPCGKNANPKYKIKGCLQ